MCTLVCATSFMHTQHDYAACRESHLVAHVHREMGQPAYRVEKLEDGRLTADGRPGAGAGGTQRTCVAAGVVRDTTLIKLASVGTHPHRYHVPCTCTAAHRWRVRVERPPSGTPVHPATSRGPAQQLRSSRRPAIFIHTIVLLARSLARAKMVRRSAIYNTAIQAPFLLEAQPDPACAVATVAQRPTRPA